jgi:hypothetical protein
MALGYLKISFKRVQAAFTKLCDTVVPAKLRGGKKVSESLGALNSSP